jgi:hypothetical protein
MVPECEQQEMERMQALVEKLLEAHAALKMTDSGYKSALQP